MFYLYISGPYDSIFEGPFTSRESAEIAQQRISSDTLDSYIITETEMQQDIEEFGPLSIQAP
jgi:hypothetical protein